MALLGDLGEFRLQYIIALLQVEKQTGELRLEREGRQVALYFRDGVLFHAVAGAETGYDAALVPFTWEDGRFGFRRYQPAVAPTITAATAAVVTAGMRRAAVAQDARARIPSLDLAAHLVAPVSTHAGPGDLSFDEWRFLTLVDGRTTLAAIGAQLGRGDLAVRLIANQLIKSGLIELRER